MSLVHVFVLAAAFAVVSPAMAEEIRAVQLDLAQQKVSVSFVKSYAKRVSEAEYNTLVLYLEDRVKTSPYPYCMDAESYSLDEMKDIVRHCTAFGLDVVPIISPLGHAERFLRHPELARIAETREGQGRFTAQKGPSCIE